MTSRAFLERTSQPFTMLTLTKADPGRPPCHPSLYTSLDSLSPVPMPPVSLVPCLPAVYVTAQSNLIPGNCLLQLKDQPCSLPSSLCFLLILFSFLFFFFCKTNTFDFYLDLMKCVNGNISFSAKIFEVMHYNIKTMQMTFLF